MDEKPTLTVVMNLSSEIEFEIFLTDNNERTEEEENISLRMVYCFNQLIKIVSLLTHKCITIDEGFDTSYQISIGYQSFLRYSLLYFFFSVFFHLSSFRSIGISNFFLCFSVKFAHRGLISGNEVLD